MKDFNNVIKRQREALREYEDLLISIENNEELRDIQIIESKLDRLNTQVAKLTKENNKLSDENVSLKIAMSEQYMVEKSGLIKNSKKNIDLYFNEQKDKNSNRLKRLEQISHNKIKETSEFVDNKLTDSGIILKEIDDFKLTIENKIAKLRNNIIITNDNLSQEINNDYMELEKEKINDNVIMTKAKRNNFETKIGLNLISKIGAILMLLGVLTLFRYTYTTWFNDYIKASIGFLVGFIFLIGGEWFSKKENNVFSVSLISIGIGVLYISIFNSYFALEIIPIAVALFLSVITTLVSVLLSTKYNSKTITIVSLIGGYLPLLSYNIYFGFAGLSLYLAMMYLLMLNISVLYLAMRKRWISVQYVSFLINLPTSMYLAFLPGNHIISLIYLLIVFIIYVGIGISNPIINNLRLRKQEIILLGLNTVVNSAAVYIMFDKLGWNDFNGALALIYALGYFLLGNYIKKKDDRKSADLFYLTAITFTALMIPLQFSLQWVSIGWLIEAVLLLHIVKTRYQDDKALSIAGWVILGLSTAFFMLYRLNDTGVSYIVNYTLLTVSLVYIAYINIDKINSLNKEKPVNTTSRKIRLKNLVQSMNLLKLYKYFVMLFAWGYIARMIAYPFENIESLYVYSGLFDSLLITGSTIMLGYVYSSEYISNNDKISEIISSFMFVISILITFGSTYSYGTDKLSPIVITLIMIVYNVIAFVGARELLNIILKTRKINLEIYVLLLSIYIFGASSLVIYNQLDSNNIGLIINIAHIVLSFAYILYGFKERKILIRRFGLGLTFYALVKLFMFEFNYVSTLGQILAYFVFGIVLMAISFMYQRLEKSIKLEASEDDKDN